MTIRRMTVEYSEDLSKEDAEALIKATFGPGGLTIAFMEMKWDRDDLKQRLDAATEAAVHMLKGEEEKAPPNPWASELSLLRVMEAIAQRSYMGSEEGQARFYLRLGEFLDAVIKDLE